MKRAPIDGMVEAIHHLNVALREAGMAPAVSIELASHDDMSRLKLAMSPWMACGSDNAGRIKIAGVVFTVSPLGEIKSALRDVAAHLVGAASAYRQHGRRHPTMKPKATIDPVFTTRAEDFDEAAKRAIRAVQRYA